MKIVKKVMIFLNNGKKLKISHSIAKKWLFKAYSWEKKLLISIDLILILSDFLY
jgi:hypothetical protein